MSEHLGMSELFEQYLQAGSDFVSLDDLTSLSQSKHGRVRLRVAENPRTPCHSLEVLANDECPEVRLAVATNASVLSATVGKLARDQDPTVRYGLAEDPNLPLAILEQLAVDENPYVSLRAIRTIRALTGLDASPVECHPYFRSRIPPSASREEGAALG